MKEAREIVLAWIAGAQVSRDAGQRLHRSFLSCSAVSATDAPRSAPHCPPPSRTSSSTRAGPGSWRSPPWLRLPSWRPRCKPHHRPRSRIRLLSRRVPRRVRQRHRHHRSRLRPPQPGQGRHRRREHRSGRPRHPEAQHTRVYDVTNAGLHAFRAGPNCNSAFPTTGCDESGGDEAWAFIPYDQLPKLKELMSPQTRTPTRTCWRRRSASRTSVPVTAGGGTTTVTIGGISQTVDDDHLLSSAAWTRCWR